MHLLLWYSIYQIWGMVAFVNPLVLWLSFTDTEFIVITMMIHFVSTFWLTGVSPLVRSSFPPLHPALTPFISHSIRVYSSWPLSCFHFPLLSQSSILLTPALFHPLCLSLSVSGWVPAAELVGLVAGVTARLSGVACDQGGRRAARTIGAERLRLTAGHLSRAISVGAEACLPLVGPAYCEDQRQSVSTLHSALVASLLSHFCLQPLTLSSPCLSLLPLYLSEFSPDVLLQLSS